MEQITDALKKRKALEADLLAKAMEDEVFREQLKADPKKTLAAFTGSRLPEALKVQVVEEKPDTLIISLPPALEKITEEAELTDEALDNVSGGIFGGIAVAFVTETGVYVYGVTKGGDD